MSRAIALLVALAIVVGGTATGGGDATAAPAKRKSTAARKAPPKVTIVSPLPTEVAVGQPVTITWRVTGGAVTRQELWLVEVDANHPSKVQLIAADLPAGARSYTWVPSRAFQTTAAQLMVRAQNDDEFVGDDARSAGIIRIRE